ncbi:hypothetical protein DMX04_00465 [Pseudomonas koreensis]|jgi:hypothetical protein|nr:hypothetical protein DMX04_00465 [Pseudomonas koreensis]
MDEKENNGVMSKEASEFLDQPATRLELIQMVQPLRGVIIPLFQAAMSSLVILINETENGEHKDRAKQSFERLNQIFQELDKFDDRLDNLIEGKPTWTTRVKEAEDE